MTHPKNILVLKSSPRLKGNSSTLADQFAQGASQAGAAVESFDLAEMDIGPCDACDFCQGIDSSDCVVADDMQILYPKLHTADLIAVASPVYWFTLSAQAKLCIDRWYALEGPGGSTLKGKQFVLILAYADSDPYSSGAINAIRTFQDMCRYLKADLAGVLYGCAHNIGDIQENTELLEQAKNLGQSLGV
ncbi:flavodoxin family protein [Chloroflexota bacterium]